MLLSSTKITHGQHATITDSLQNLLAGAPSNDSLRLWWQYQLGLVYVEEDAQSADSLAALIIDETSSTGYSPALAWGYHLRSVALYRLGLADKALEAARQMLDSADLSTDQSLLAQTGQLAARIAQEQDKRTEAIRYNQLALGHARQAADSSRVADIYQHLGDLYFLQNDLDRSLSFYQRAVILRRSEGDLHRLSESALGVGLVYLKQGKYESAYQYLNQALNYRRAVQDEQGILTALTYLGDLHHVLGNYQLAISHYNESLRLARSLSLAQQQRQLLSRLIDSQAAAGDYQQALSLVTQRRALSDSLLQHQLASLQSQLEEAKQERVIERMEHRAEVRSLWWRVIAVGIPFLLLFIITLLLFARYRYRQRLQVAVPNTEATPDDLKEKLRQFLTSSSSNGTGPAHQDAQQTGRQFLAQLEMLYPVESGSDDGLAADHPEVDTASIDVSAPSAPVDPSDKVSEEDIPIPAEEPAPPSTLQAPLESQAVQPETTEPETEATASLIGQQENQPITEEPDVPLIVPPAPVRQTSVPVVLLISNSYQLRKYICLTLGPDFHFLEAADSLDAVSFAREQRPHVVICDGELPDIDSLALCKLLSKEAGRRLPVILLDELHHLSSSQTEIDIVLSKPVNTMALRRYLARLLKIYPPAK